MSQGAATTDERVLSTLNADGSRRWLRPRLSPGRFLTARRIVAYALILVFTIVPYLTIGGTPVLRLDIVGRQFHILGHTFLPTDTALMAVIFIGIFFSVFLITAILGRVWCGWACPQTVYMEFLYRPIERLIEGAPGKKQRIRSASGARKALKYAIYLVVSLFLAHTFLAYFVAPERLLQWMRGSPFEHPAAFLVMAVTTGLMMFDFAYFREQVCTVACPYGRLQSVMLDRHSLIITYDEDRGEPRGKQRRRKHRDPSGDVSLKVVEDKGDCIDCYMCVTTCPTGIDIRDGLQMECIACAQCIDACDSVMDKIGKPRGLIRYSSDAILSGQAKSIIRPRVFLYPTALAVLAVIFVVLLGGRQGAEARVLPRQGATYYALPSGEIANQVRLRIVNRSERTAEYAVAVGGHEDARIIADTNTVTLEPSESADFGFIVAMPPEAFAGTGGREVTLTVTGGEGFEDELTYHLLGPASTRGATPDADGMAVQNGAAGEPRPAGSATAPGERGGGDE